MNNNKILAALCYFSVFFAPLLLPIIVFFITDDKEIKHHAKRSLVSHLIPTILLVAGFIIFSFSMLSFQDQMFGSGFGFWQLTPFLFMLLYGVLFLAIVIWNVIQGVKVMR